MFSLLPLFIALCAVLGGAEGWEDIETLGKAKKAWFDQKLLLTEGIPSQKAFLPTTRFGA